MGAENAVSVQTVTTTQNYRIDTEEPELKLTPVQVCIKNFAKGLRYRYREYTAEFFSTFIMLVFGLGSVHTAMLSPSKENFFSINWGWGLALTMGIYCNVGISGSHLNPAITVALAVSRGFPWSKVPGYIFSQVLGAFCAAGIVYGLYYQPINLLDGGVRQVIGENASAAFYAAYPEPFLNHGNAFFIEFILTAIMTIIVLSANDHRNSSHSAIIPIVIGLMLVCIGVTIGGLNGYSLNPARDFGPRLFTLIAGWGTETFTAYNGYFWVPIVAPIVGAVFGAISFDFFYLIEPPNTDYF